MSPRLQRRLVLKRALSGLTVAAPMMLKGPQAGAQASPRVITMQARRFRYEPAEIPLRVGVAVVIEITALDFAHGMKIPDLKLRLDLLPGLVTRLPLQPQQPGVIDFLCDNFCGEDHEDMHGRFIVSA